MKRDRLFVVVLTAALLLNLSALRNGWPGLFGWFIWPWY